MRLLLRSQLLRCVFAASAVTGAAHSAIAAACKPLQMLMSLDLNELASGEPVIQARIVETPELFLIDTAGASSSVTPAIVQKYKLKPRRSRRSLTGLTVPGLDFGISNLDVRLPS